MLKVRDTSPEYEKFFQEADEIFIHLLSMNTNNLEERIDKENMLLFQNREDVIMKDIYNRLVSNYFAKATGRPQDIQTLCICQTYGIGKTCLLNELIPYILKEFRPENASQQEKNEFKDVFSNTLHIKFDLRTIDNDYKFYFDNFASNFTYYFLKDFFKELFVDDEKLKVSVQNYSKELFNKLVELIVGNKTYDIDLFGISKEDFFVKFPKPFKYIIISIDEVGRVLDLLTIFGNQQNIDAYKKEISFFSMLKDEKTKNG
jgi:hypothetical protein